MKGKLLFSLLLLFAIILPTPAVQAGGELPPAPAMIRSVTPAPPHCVLRHADQTNERVLELTGDGFGKPDHNINLQFRRPDTGEESIHFHNEVDWESDTRILLDVASIREMLWPDHQVTLTVRLTSFQDGNFVPISDWSPAFILAEIAAACVPPDDIQVGVYVLTFNPLIDGQALSQYMGWNEPDALMSQYAADVREVSGGTVNYYLVRQAVIPGYPPKADGFVFSNDQYLQCLSNRDAAAFCRPLIDYPTMLNTRFDPEYLSVCEAIAAGEVDEVWTWGGPLFEFLEWRLIEPQTACEDVAQPFYVMGFNYERGVAEMLHDLGHRAEAVLQHKLGLELWDQFDGQRHRYDQIHSFHCPAEPGQLEVDTAKTSCGNVHFPPNAYCHYQYTRYLPVESDCDDWLNYPDLTGQKTIVSADTWSGDPYGYIKWWLGHLPRRPGSSNGIYHNWWKYVFLQPDLVTPPEVTPAENDPSDPEPVAAVVPPVTRPEPLPRLVSLALPLVPLMLSLVAAVALLGWWLLSRRSHRISINKF